MKIRNIEVDFSFLDADDVEKFEQEAERVKSNFLNDPNGFYVMNFRKLFGETQED